MGGTVIPLDVMQAVRAVADEEGLPLHLDGARMANAAAALGVGLKDVAAPFHSVSLCLSKGLGAPVGSVLAGSKADLVRAHRYRKMLGGGMRQAGILAAAGLIALRDGPARLSADHARARKLAEALVEAGYAVNLEAVQTNIIYATIPDAQQKVEQWAEQGVLASALDIDSVRFVLHYQIDDEMLARAIGVLTA